MAETIRCKVWLLDGVRREAGFITLSDNPTPHEIVSALKGSALVILRAKTSSFEIEWTGLNEATVYSCGERVFQLEVI